MVDKTGNGASNDATEHKKATQPDDVARLVIERFNAGDADGVAELYAADAVLAFPPGHETVGRQAIRAVYRRLMAQPIRFQPEQPLPTVCYRDLALTSTRSADNTGTRVQVLRRQPDGSWLRIIDRPESKT